jgi:hypothetical protein
VTRCPQKKTRHRWRRAGLPKRSACPLNGRKVPIALRKRAAAIRSRAASGVTVIDVPFTIVKTSEDAHAFKIASDLDRVADDLENDGGA